jgi:UPF0271 protein
MMAAESEELSRAIIKAIQKMEPGLILYCMDASVTYHLAKEMGESVAAKFYADRDYAADGKSSLPDRWIRSLTPERSWP